VDLYSHVFDYELKLLLKLVIIGALALAAAVCALYLLIKAIRRPRARPISEKQYLSSEETLYPPADDDLEEWVRAGRANGPVEERR
jgi:hypothetical protein